MTAGLADCSRSSPGTGTDRSTEISGIGAIAGIDVRPSFLSRVTDGTNTFRESFDGAATEVGAPFDIGVDGAHGTAGLPIGLSP